MSHVDYHSAAHSVYLTQYHIIWCPKYRYPVLEHGRDALMKKNLHNICAHRGYTIKALEVMPDHIHIFIDAPHTEAPCDIARALKSLSARAMLAECPDLRAFYSRCRVLWSRGYFISTIGHVSENTVRNYIEGQKNGNKDKAYRH